MTTTHVARAGATTTNSAPPWRVELRAGAHHLIADESIATGGGDAGPTPFELVLSGLAACTATTLRMHAERKGWMLTAVEVDVRYDVTDDDQASIVRTITVPAELPTAQRERLARIAERTPVTRAVRAGTSITTTVRTAGPQ